MKNANIIIALVIFFGIILGLKYSYYDNKAQEEHPSIHEIATVPDQLMRNASHYYRDYGQRFTAIEYMQKAVESMKIMEKDMDDTSNAVIETAIADLEVLIDEFQRKEVDENHMDHAFANALNSLAFAQLRVSELYIKQEKYDNASAATRFALDHLSSAMFFSESADFRTEKHLYEMVENLKTNDTISDEEMRSQIHQVVIALNKVLSEANTVADISEENE